MTDIDQGNMSKNFDEDWAIFPFDQTTDGKRWVKLIEEIDDLANNNEINRPQLAEYSVGAGFAQPRLTKNSSTSDDGFSRQRPF
ncbi:MAG: hypothetical protein WBD27_07155 [Pyrinomonadaceae bacterium]